MEGTYLSYLALLEDLSKHLRRLTALAQQKTAAVRRDDLMELDQVLKQEQALALTLRGMEQKRLKLLAELGLSEVSLSNLAAHYPPALRQQAKAAAEALQRDYQLYRGTAEVARNTLEINLHQIEKFLEERGGGSLSGPGYAPSGSEPPPAMKTDFRA